MKRHDQADGFLLAVAGRRLADGEGRPLGGVVTFRDVTGQKAAENSLHGALSELRQQKELLENVFDSLHEGVSVFDRDGTYLMLNREGRRLARIDGEDGDLSMLSRSFELLHADDGAPLRPEERPVERVLRGEALDDVQFCVPFPDGENDLYFSAGGRPLLDADGAVRGGVTVFRDVTERRLREQRLQALAEEHRTQRLALEAVLSSISDGVVVVDGRGTTMRVTLKTAPEAPPADSP